MKKKNNAKPLYVAMLIFAALSVALFIFGAVYGSKMIVDAKMPTDQTALDFLLALPLMLIFAFVFTFFDFMAVYLAAKVKDFGTQAQKNVSRLAKYVCLALIVAEIVLIVIFYFML